MNFENDEFKEFEEYVMRWWRPNTEMYMYTIKDSLMDKWLSNWFENEEEESISIGPYIEIIPYGKFNSKENKMEYLFICDHIDNTKLTGEQFLLGRSDFVDL